MFENLDTDLNYSETWDYLESNQFINPLALAQSQNLYSSTLDNFDLRQSGIDLYNIVGCKSATFDKVTASFDKYNWDFEPTTLISGDRTVPLPSARTLAVDADHLFYLPKADHGSMLTAEGIRQELVNIVSGSNLDTPGLLRNQDVLVDPNLCKLGKAKRIKIFSPLNIEALDDQGNRLGFAEDGSLEASIPGSDFEVFGDHKFAYLPEDADQTYTINLNGTDTGTFTLVAEEMLDGEVTSTQTFSDVPVTTALSGQLVFADNLPVLKLDTDADGIQETSLHPDEEHQDPGTIETETPPVVDPVVTVPEPTVPTTASGGGCCPGSSEPTLQIVGKVLGASLIQPGTLVLDPADHRTVYIIGTNGKKYGFINEQIFLGFGFKFDWLTTADLTTIESGDLIDSLKKPHPDGTLILDRQTIWQIRAGERFGFVTMESFSSRGFALNAVVPANSFDQVLPQTVIFSD